jgi:protein-disulfide isomerase/thiol-disulfide isomerase/thioredoxin/uncharacterized membrane protein
VKDKLVPILFVAAAAFGAYWALDLIAVHYDTVAGLDSGKCQDGGCGAVLQSEWSELFGVPVSVPAVPMYAVLALLGVLAMMGKVDRARVSTLATAAGLGGVAFGGWLLFHMLYHVDSVCKFCLIMDGANLAVLAFGALLHPDGPAAPFKALLSVPKNAMKSGPELTLALAVLMGTPLVHGATQREPVEELPVVVETPAPTPSVAKTTPRATPKARATPVGRPAQGTRRVVVPEEVHDLKIADTVPWRGPKNAPVDIVVFEDFQCPFCKKLSGNLEVLLEERDDVRMAFMHFPMHQSCNAATLRKNLHKFACGAATSAVCAEQQGKFWEVHDLQFRNNGRLRGKNLRQYANEAGLDMAAWTACMKDPTTKDKVIASSKVGADAGVTGTPAVFINGRKMVGAQSVASLNAIIDALAEDPAGRKLLDVELAGEVTGDVDAPAVVSVQGAEGVFTIDAFEASLEGNAAVSKPGVESARGVTWYEAKAACESAGKRLCTEKEWLTACSGAIPLDDDRDGVFSNDIHEGRQHAYGEHWREGWCADSRKRADPRPLITGEHPKCATPDGIYDLEGLTKEWVGVTPDKAALKGGSYFSGNSARCAYHKDTESPELKDESVGFRCCGGGDTSDEVAAAENRYPGGKVGDKMLQWEGTLVDGGTLKLADLAGKPVVMTFWASWCAPCKKELPVLAEFYETYKDQGLQVIGMNVDSDPKAARAHLKKNPLPFPVVLDTNKDIMNRFHSRGVPTTFWVTKDGTIRQRSVGYDDEARPKVERWLRELLGS